MVSPTWLTLPPVVPRDGEGDDPLVLVRGVGVVPGAELPSPADHSLQHGECEVSS